ncbi:MAG: DNA recombination protein RmuC [Bacteroidales bacterium]|nr:DNA recombination protein RmuC [Bacteroidales bacterium]
METYMIVTAGAAVITAICTWLITRGHFKNRLKAQEELHERRISDMEKMAAQAQANYDKALKDMKETVVTSMTAETEKLLRKREKELSEGNQSTMDSILKPLKESMDAMEKAMKANESSHVETTARLSEQLKQAVKDMQEKTSDVGRKADTLSEALTGKPKVQGCFGENFLEAILAGEGLEEGKHYSRESANDDLSRPDFVFHFKEGLEQKDLIVDSKVSLTAFVDYMNAASDEEKALALDRHLRSVSKHIDELARKEYAKKNAHSFADYVLMFMPRDMAFRVALEADPMLWQEAYRKGVLIATEQTIMPFLKIMQLTWNKFQHDTNTRKITAAAQNMIDRVASFYDSYTELGRKLKAVCGEYNKGITKLQDNGQSITTSARQVISMGVRRSKGKEFSVPEDLIKED